MAHTITRKQLQERLENGLPTRIVEALPAKYYDHAHLPGAINIPHDRIEALANDLLPDRDAFIVVYCASTQCRNSSIAADTLTRLGYRHVHEYVEGKKDWIDAGLPVERNQAAAA